MSARQSSAVDEALRLVAGGMTPYKAAQTTGIAFGTIYKAIKRQKANLDPDTIVDPAKEGPQAI